MSQDHHPATNHRQSPWNKGRLVGQKRPLKPKEVWNIRARLQIEARKRDLAMFNLAIDSKLRGCDLVHLKIDDLCVGGRLRDRATIIQKKTGRPVQFEITEQTRASVEDWLAVLKSVMGAFFFQVGSMSSPTFRRANMLGSSMIGFEAPAWTTRHTARIRCGEPRPPQIYKKTGNLRAVQLLLGHTKLESTVRYLGIEVDDALSISEQVEL